MRYILPLSLLIWASMLQTSLCKQDICYFAVQNSDSCALVVVIEMYIAIEVVPL